MVTPVNRNVAVLFLRLIIIPSNKRTTKEASGFIMYIWSGGFLGSSKIKDIPKTRADINDATVLCCKDYRRRGFCWNENLTCCDRRSLIVMPKPVWKIALTLWDAKPKSIAICYCYLILCDFSTYVFLEFRNVSCLISWVLIFRYVLSVWLPVDNNKFVLAH